MESSGGRWLIGSKNCDVFPALCESNIRGTKSLSIANWLSAVTSDPNVVAHISSSGGVEYR